MSMATVRLTRTQMPKSSLKLRFNRLIQQRLGLDPRIVSISYSTGTSGAGAEVEKVAEQELMYSERTPSWSVDWWAVSVPMQHRLKVSDAWKHLILKLHIVPMCLFWPKHTTGNTTYKPGNALPMCCECRPNVARFWTNPVKWLSCGTLVDDICVYDCTPLQFKQNNKQQRKVIMRIKPSNWAVGWFLFYSAQQRTVRSFNFYIFTKHSPNTDKNSGLLFSET